MTALSIAIAALSGCSWQHAYSAAQGWQRNQCDRLVERAQRERCLGGTNMPYDDYRRQTETARKN